VPQVFLHNFEHNHVLHEQIVVLTVVTKDVPYVDVEHRLKVRAFGKNQNFYRVKLYYGFQQSPDVRQALEQCAQEGLNIDFNQASFFIGSERLSFRKKSPMPQWRRPLFRFLFHNASSAIEFFKIPIERVIELGIRIEL
jgi:KUP system potassium uptake protein